MERAGTKTQQNSSQVQLFQFLSEMDQDERERERGTAIMKEKARRQYELVFRIRLG
jgi:hypothetical protein